MIWQAILKLLPGVVIAVSAIATFAYTSGIMVRTSDIATRADLREVVKDNKLDHDKIWEAMRQQQAMLGAQRDAIELKLDSIDSRLMDIFKLARQNGIDLNRVH